MALVADERVARRQFRSAFFFYRKAESLQPELRCLHTSIATVYKEMGHKDWAETEQRKQNRWIRAIAQESRWLVIFPQGISTN